MGLAGSKMLEAGKQVGLRVASEVFADRAYQADGSLVPRKQPGAVIHDKDEAIARTIRMVTEGKVTAITGEEVSIDAHLHLRPRRQPPPRWSSLRTSGRP